MSVTDQLQQGEIVIFDRKAIVCPAGREMELSRIGVQTVILSHGPLTEDSARQAFTPIDYLTARTSEDLEMNAHCPDCPIGGCSLTGSVEKER